MFSINRRGAFTYFHGERGKGGGTTRGDNRTVEYEKEHAWKFLPPPTVTAVNDIDNMREDVQRGVTDMVLDLCRELRCPRYPKTLAEAVGYGMNGLPTAKQIDLHSMVADSEECKTVGGAFEQDGRLRRFGVNVLEIGMQESMRRRGLEIEEESACNEPINNKVSDEYFHEGEQEVFSNLRAAMPAIFSTQQEWEIASTESHSFSRKRLAWPNGRTPSLPPNHHFAKEVISKCVLGGDAPNAFDSSPVENPTSVAECFAADEYPDEKRWDAVDVVVLEDICVLEIDGGFGAADKCHEAWKATVSGSLVTYLTEERETLLGHEAGSGWFVVWTFYGIYVLKLVWDGDDKLRILVVFCPWCKLIFAKNGVRIGPRLLTRAEGVALSAHWLFNFRKLIEEPNSTLVPDTSLDRPVQDNIWFHHCCTTVQFIMMDHYASNSSGHDLKNRVVGAALNLNQPDCTNLVQNRHNRAVFGHNVRLLIARRPEDGVDRMSLDKLWAPRALKLASAQRTIPNAAESLVRSIRAVDEPVKRYNALRDETDDDGKPLLLPELRKALKTAYEGTKANAGNTSAHHATNAAAIDDLDKVLKAYAKSGKKFFVQADGNADPKLPLKKSNRSIKLFGGDPAFVVPEDGVLLNVEPGKGDPPVVFRRADFVRGIGHVGLCGRCYKETNGPNNTATATCWRTKDYKIETTKGIARYARRQVQWMNRYHVAEVRFVPV